MNDQLKFQQTVLSELASIHATLALLEECYFHLQSDGLTAAQKNKLVAAAALKKELKFRILCSQAGVAYPPEIQGR
jgi:hypothetical protein